MSAGQLGRIRDVLYLRQDGLWRVREAEATEMVAEPLEAFPEAPESFPAHAAATSIAFALARVTNRLITEGLTRCLVSPPA